MVGPCSSEPLPFQASHWKCRHSSSSSVAKCYGNQHTALSPILSWKSLSHTPLEPILIWPGVCVRETVNSRWVKWGRSGGRRSFELHVQQSTSDRPSVSSGVWVLQPSQSGGKVQPEPTLSLRGDRKEFFRWPSGRRESLTPVQKHW